MPSAQDLTSYAFMLKEYYTRDVVEQAFYKDNAALALMPRHEKFPGELLQLPLVIGSPQSRSADFATAQAKSVASPAAPTRGRAFNLTRVRDYCIVTIDNETIEASADKEGAFMEAATLEIDMAYESLRRSLGKAIYGTGFGDRGVINAGGIAGAVITLSNTDDIVNFEQDMDLVAAANVDTAATKVGTGTIASVNPSAGTITLTAAVPGAWAAGDVLFASGDRQATGTIVARLISGFEAWIPRAAPTATAFFGVDRTAHTTRLGGQRLDMTGVNILDALAHGATVVAREGHALTHYFVSFNAWRQLVNTLGSHVQYVDLKVGQTGVVSFRAIEINGSRGTIKVVPDVNCPTNRIFGVNLDYWKLYSLGQVPKMLGGDGNEVLRQGAADGIEARLGYRAQLGCRLPGANINILWS